MTETDTTREMVSGDGGRTADALLFPLDGIDLDRVMQTREQVLGVNPHRGQMALLDGVIWASEDFGRAVAFKDVRDDEFWVPGHFPDRPMMPGVLQVETGAQLCCWMFNMRLDRPHVSAFLRLDNCVFRSSVVPGDRLLLLANELKRGRRNFSSEIQGVVGDRIAFDAHVKGMSLGPMQPVE